MFNNNIYIIYMDIYREKYLKYKKKYLELQKGGNIMTDNGFNEFKSFVGLFNDLNKLLKTNFNFEMNPNRTEIDIPKQLRLSSSNMYYKLSNVRDGNKIIFGETSSLIDRITKNIEYKIKLINSKAVILKDNDNYRLSINLKDEIQIGGAQTYSIEMLIIIITNERRQYRLVRYGDFDGDIVGDFDGDIVGDFDGDIVGEVVTRPPKLSQEELRIKREKNNRDLNIKILKEISLSRENRGRHIDNYGLIDKAKTLDELKNNKLFLINVHGSVMKDNITLKPGQRVIVLKYFTLFYLLPREVAKLIIPLFTEHTRQFDKILYLNNIGGIKIGDQTRESKFYRKYGIYDGNIDESRTLPNMIFTPLEQRDIKIHLDKRMYGSLDREGINTRFEENPSLYDIRGGIMEVPITFTNRMTGEKLNLKNIFDFKNKKINIPELRKHNVLFTGNSHIIMYDKIRRKRILSLTGNSDILKLQYDTPQIYISPHDFVRGTRLDSIIRNLEERGIDKFTLFITSCKEIKYSDPQSDQIGDYKYFDLKDYMDSLR
jgi:hypothetical protein